MPTHEHQALVDLCRDDPSVVRDLVESAFQLHLPPDMIVSESTFSETASTDLHADLVLQAPDGADESTPDVILEVQQTVDEDKRYSWPHYVTSQWRRRRRPVVLVVLTTSPAVARRVPQRIEPGPGSAVAVHMVGPDRIPPVTDPSGHAALTVLAALAHGRGVDSLPVVKAGIAALELARLDDDQVRFFYDCIVAKLDDVTRAELEAFMEDKGYEYKTEFARRYVAQGRTEGHAEGRTEGRAEGIVDSIITVLAARNITPTADETATLRSCHDAQTLLLWLKRAASASSARDLFDA